MINCIKDRFQNLNIECYTAESFKEYIKDYTKYASSSKNTIYQSISNPMLGYKVCNCPVMNKNTYNDIKLISQLVERQDEVSLADFPTGKIIAVDGKVTAHEIVLYDGVPSLYDFSGEENRNILPTVLYLDILKVIKQMYEAGIYYIDIHAFNFFVVLDNKIKMYYKDISSTIRTIDYESQYVKIDKIKKIDLKYMFENFSLMIRSLNNDFQIRDIVGPNFMAGSFDDMEDKIYKMEYKLNRTGYIKCNVK